ncbi:uncharacterized protein LOC133334206 [Musca vetustissima]|uniref:uncharacterized protein LOC133334206 n=1 Tax=Musca vetustissima TaxID=27455 RepID=UPI002AB6310A|nr:uncharacterized protein LOC133334206 [Musca vetustissima]
MEATPKVHRHRPRRTESRHRRTERQTTTTSSTSDSKSPARSTNDILNVEAGGAGSSSDALIAAVATRLMQEHERQTSTETVDTVASGSGGTGGGHSSSQTSQQTVVLVNGHAPHDQATEDEQPANDSATTHHHQAKTTNENNDPAKPSEADASELCTGPPDGPSSSRNSSGDAMSLRETLQQLPPTITAHRHRRTLSPHSPSRRVLETAADASFHRGILGFMDRELKQSSPTPSALSAGSGGGGNSGGAGRKHQSLSDPTASPAQRSVRSRSSLEKSPRRKRSKSESRRRRERKLIAAGEMEVRQANETLMRYLKQCSEMNDASLSGELEIDQSLEERKVHRKTKSQRNKRGHIISKFYAASGLTSLLKELSDDIMPAEGEEIYNPFTPVVSPTDDTPAHIDKMFMQTSSGYRPVDHCYAKHSFMRSGGMSGQVSGDTGGGGGGIGDGSGGSGGGIGGNAGYQLRPSGSYGDTRCLLDGEYYGHEITSNIQLACLTQRIWLLLSNICHGLLAGLALAHLLFVLSTHPMEWSKVLSLAGETSSSASSSSAAYSSSSYGDSESATTESPTIADGDFGSSTMTPPVTTTSLVRTEYASFANFYINTFYCLAIVCMVSVLDRMDICRWNLSNASELISFRWLIIAMIYIATIILTICSDNIDERLYFSSNLNVTLTQEELLINSIVSIWSSLSVTRSIGAICGWIMIGLTPHEDFLYEHLLDLTRYQMTNN